MSKEMADAFGAINAMYKKLSKENEKLTKERNNQAEIIEKLTKALKFYGNEKYYFKKEVETDLNQTTAIFKEEYRKNNPDISKPNVLKSHSYECSARIKLDQGETARKALKELEND